MPSILTFQLTNKTLQMRYRSTEIQQTPPKISMILNLKDCRMLSLLQSLTMMMQLELQKKTSLSQKVIGTIFTKAQPQQNNIILTSNRVRSIIFSGYWTLQNKICRLQKLLKSQSHRKRHASTPLNNCSIMRVPLILLINLSMNRLMIKLRQTQIVQFILLELYLTSKILLHKLRQITMMLKNSFLTFKIY